MLCVYVSLPVLCSCGGYKTRHPKKTRSCVVVRARVKIMHIITLGILVVLRVESRLHGALANYAGARPVWLFL